MAICSRCGSGLDDRSPFCSYCGFLARESKHLSYSASVVLGIALMMFALVWQLISLAPPTTTTQVITPEPPDDAAVFIQNCGQPDADKPEIKNGLQSRSLLYRKAKVNVVFVRADWASRWTRQAIIDLTTRKPLPADKLAKRLPCASGKSGP